MIKVKQFLQLYHRISRIFSDPSIEGSVNKKWRETATKFVRQNGGNYLSDIHKLLDRNGKIMTKKQKRSGQDQQDRNGVAKKTGSSKRKQDQNEPYTAKRTRYGSRK